MFSHLGEGPLLMTHILFSVLAAVPSTLSFVHDDVGNSRRRLKAGELLAAKKINEPRASPLEQIKLDFLGSLDNAYDFNPKNRASTEFLDRLVDQATPETVTRDMIESFELLGTGKWRIVYVQDFSSSFGFGSFFRDVSAGEVELGNDGSITSKIQCSDPSPYQVSVKGTFGTARNNMLIKVGDVQSEQVQSETDDGLLSELKGVPLSITRSILEKNWPTIFSGLVIIDIAFIDDNLAIFDLDFLARLKGRRICARKEPDFF